MEFDVDSLRIRDLGEDESDGATSTAPSSVLSNLKRTNSQPVDVEDPNEGGAVGKIRAQTDSTALRGFLNNLGSE